MGISPNVNKGKAVTFAIYSNGSKVSDSYLFKSIEIHREVNRIGRAVLKILAGDMPDANVPESESDIFKPGQAVRIELGYESDNTNVFNGIVVAQKIQIPKHADSSPLLVVECRDDAVKSTVARKNRVFEKKKDSEVIQAVLEDSGLSADVDSTPVKYTQLVQYYCTDWDFALSRADANGLLVITDGSRVKVKKPDVSGSPVLQVSYGTDLLSFDGELYAEEQFETVESVGWSASEQKVVIADSSPVSLNAQGNSSLREMASAAGADKITLQADAMSDSNALQSWANATLLKSGLARYRGTFSFCGNAAAVPGCIIKLGGLGERFNGDVFVGSVTHTVQGGTWTTEVEMGISPLSITQQQDVMAPPASGWIPAIEGLHIGVVTKLADDPEDACRIQVKIPVLNVATDKVWARLLQWGASDKSGSYFIPSVGDEVILGFLNNDPNQAVILGSMYSARNMPPYGIDENNYKRAIVSPENLKIEMDDEKKVITITTPGKNSIIISDDAKGMTLKDQNGNKVVMDDSGIALTSAKDIKLSAKGNILLDAVGKLALKTQRDATLEGMNVTAKAQVALKVCGSASAEISASGQTTVKGAMVMIN